jgi:beta-lactamase superfamily II metal-dependent hydrolase
VNKLELRVFNVGHGLSVALIERPENYVTVVDLGASTGFTPLKHLSLVMKVKPDVLYITHPHADHLDDVETALDKTFRPLGIYYQDYDWEDVKKREKKELAYKVDKFKELITVVPRNEYGGAASLKFWRYTPAGAKKQFGDATYVNNSSLFIIYRWRDFKISITGDLESDGMQGLLDIKEFCTDAKGTDILIPAHHGHTNGFPTDWVAKVGKPHISIISVQERDQHVDGRYSKPDFAHGVTFGGEKRYRLTTRSDGSIAVDMYYGADGGAKWSFQSF